MCHSINLYLYTFSSSLFFSISEYNGNEDPELVVKLSHGPTKFGEFAEEEILDIQCTNFYTSIQTAKGKVFWWYVIKI